MVLKWRSPSTAAMTTRSIAVSVAVVILYSRGKAKNSEGAEDAEEEILSLNE